MTQRSDIHRIIAAVAGFTLLVAACGSDDSVLVADPPPTELADDFGTATTSTTDTDTAVPTTGGGWIDGEPDWDGSAGGDGGDGDLALASGQVPTKDFGGDTASGEVEESSESATRDAPIPVEPDGGPGDGAAPPIFDDEVPVEEPMPPIDQPVDAAPLRAGSVDDNADFGGFLAYLDRIAELGVVTRDLDPTGRSIITVVDEAGRPVPGIALEVGVDDQLVTLRTTADGTVRFHPAFYGLATNGVAELGFALADTERVPVAAGEDVTMIASSAVIAAPVPLDVLFLLDATGSMGDEIDRLKQTIDTVAERVTALDPAPDVRFAMTLYRDEGDAFVTASYDFTADIDEFQAALSDVVASGGGDYPEALDEGLADALAKPAWRDPADAVQLIFIVADAPPQVLRQVDIPYTDSVRTAIERGIKIFPVASSESDDQAEAVFRQMAQATGAPFVFLSNGAAGAATGGSTDITSTDYEELALDELVVRLIAEELSGLSGDDGDIIVPTTTPPVTTNPDGQ